MTRGGARFKGVLWGGILLAAGVWFLLQRLGVELPNFFSALWPIFPFMFGVAFLVTYFTSESKDCGLVWPGTFGVLLGSFFFLFSLKILDWERMSELWPVFPIIVGFSFLATWIVGGFRETGLLVPATITLAVGWLGLGFELGWLDRERFDLLWPLALILFGAWMVMRSQRPSLAAERRRQRRLERHEHRVAGHGRRMGRLERKMRDRFGDEVSVGRSDPDE